MAEHAHDAQARDLDGLTNQERAYKDANRNETRDTAPERPHLELEQSDAIGDASNRLAEVSDIIRDRLTDHPHAHELQNLIAQADRLLRQPDLDAILERIAKSGNE